MARSRATIFTSLWEPDSEFRDLSANAQRVYLMLLSQADLSLCGVIAITVRQWAHNATDTTVETVWEGLHELDAAAYIFLDEEEQQLRIRTFAKHDGVLRQPNIIVAMSKDFNAIKSQPLREGFLKGLPEGLLEGLAKGYRERLGQPFVEGLLRVCARAPTSDLRLTTSVSPHAEPASTEPPDAPETVTSLTAGRKRDEAFAAAFERCWEHYPRKIEKQAALRAYKATRRRGVPAEDLLKATRHFAEHMLLAQRDREHIKHGSTFFGPDQPWTEYVAGAPEPAAVNGHTQRISDPPVNWQ